MSTELTTSKALQALDTAVRTWAASKTKLTSQRRGDLQRDKINAVKDFVNYVKIHPAQATPADVLDWWSDLIERGFEVSTVYGMVSKLSSFYKWAMQTPETRAIFGYNPIVLARPEFPKMYQGKTVKAIAPKDVKALLDTVREIAATGDVSAKRDYALLLFFITSGMRRSEILGLRWCDVNIGDTNMVTARVKGGKIRTVEIKDERAWRALFDYLEVSDRLWDIGGEAPLWARHDPKATEPHQRLSTHGFAKRVKDYARQADIGDIHLHQFRHSFAKHVAETAGSITEAQEALGHENLATTKIYVQRLSVKRDRYGSSALDEVL